MSPDADNRDIDPSPVASPIACGDETLNERFERREREIRQSFEQCQVCFYQPASDCIVAECPWRAQRSPSDVSEGRQS